MFPRFYSFIHASWTKLTLQYKWVSIRQLQSWLFHVQSYLQKSNWWEVPQKYFIKSTNFHSVGFYESFIKGNELKLHWATISLFNFTFCFQQIFVVRKTVYEIKLKISSSGNIQSYKVGWTWTEMKFGDQINKLWLTLIKFVQSVDGSYSWVWV